MTKYNENFTLNIEELELIETALNTRKDELAKTAITSNAEQYSEVHAIQQLLGHLHNQKTFFRPKNEQCISG